MTISKHVIHYGSWSGFTCFNLTTSLTATWRRIGQFCGSDPRNCHQYPVMQIDNIFIQQGPSNSIPLNNLAITVLTKSKIYLGSIILFFYTIVLNHFFLSLSPAPALNLNKIMSPSSTM